MDKVPDMPDIWTVDQNPSEERPSSANRRAPSTSQRRPSQRKPSANQNGSEQPAQPYKTRITSLRHGPEPTPANPLSTRPLQLPTGLDARSLFSFPVGGYTSQLPITGDSEGTLTAVVSGTENVMNDKTFGGTSDPKKGKDKGDYGDSDDYWSVQEKPLYEEPQMKRLASMAAKTPLPPSAALASGDGFDEPVVELKPEPGTQSHLDMVDVSLNNGGQHNLNSGGNGDSQDDDQSAEPKQDSDADKEEQHSDIVSSTDKVRKKKWINYLIIGCTILVMGVSMVFAFLFAIESKSPINKKAQAVLAHSGNRMQLPKFSEPRATMIEQGSDTNFRDGTYDGESTNSFDEKSYLNYNGMPLIYKGTILDIDTWMDTRDFNTTFTTETVGGLSIMGLNTTYDDSTQANKHVPPMNETFPYGTLPIRGVNLGGWLVLEPFITPSLFENYDLKDGVIDEWTLVEHLNKTKGYDEVIRVLEKHYSTFVTEDTFREIQDAGLDHVRIPVGYWAVHTWNGEMFVPHISWRYLLRGIEWARKYGIRVNIDLHSLPGGQNGWNHSGRQGVLNWLRGPDGDEFGEKALEIHKALATFFSQDRYVDLVTMYGLANEPRMMDLEEKRVVEWSKRAYNAVREQGYEGVIVFGDGFKGVRGWHGQFDEVEYPAMALDVHMYTIFDQGLLHQSHVQKLQFVCGAWRNDMAFSSNAKMGHGPTFVGEWSQADNDCTRFLNDIGKGSRWEGDLWAPGHKSSVGGCYAGTNCTCSISNSDPMSYTPEYRQFLRDFAEAQMEAFESNGGWGSMYWTWDTETAEASQWSYRRGRLAGTMPWKAWDRKFRCDGGIKDYYQLGLPEHY